MKHIFERTHLILVAVGGNGRFPLPAEFFAEPIEEQFPNRTLWSRLC